MLRLADHAAIEDILLDDQDIDEFEDSEPEIVTSASATNNNSLKVRIDPAELEQEVESEAEKKRISFREARIRGIHTHYLHFVALLCRFSERSLLVEDQCFQEILLDRFRRDQMENEILDRNGSEFSIEMVQYLLVWMGKVFSEDRKNHLGVLESSCSRQIECLRFQILEKICEDSEIAVGSEDLSIIFAALCKSIGMHVRLVTAISPLSHLPSKLKERFGKNSTKPPLQVCSNCPFRMSKVDAKDDVIVIDQEDDDLKLRRNPKRKMLAPSKNDLESESDFIDDDDSKVRRNPKRKISSRSKNDLESESDFVDEKKSKRQNRAKSEKSKGKSAAKVPKNFFNSSENLALASKHLTTWVELYIDSESRWIHVDPFFNLIDKPKFCSPSIYYVVSSESGIGMKDVTKRYAERWSVVIKKRIFKDELTQSIINSVSNVVLGCSIDSLFYENIQRNSEEDEELDRIAESEPIPKTLDSIKNHPLYVIEKHLKKYEAIYPMHPVLGQLAQHKVYSRSNVHTLHTKDRWIREMRQVNDNESPYKTVKGKSTSELELFGKWQTHPWTPPKAIDGMVPKNDRGNVELWSDAHLPEGTVQIQLQGASTICRKLGIDYAPALVGFEIRGGRSVPVLDGIIICKEYEQSVRDACDEHNNRKNREEADRLWRLLLRGVWAHHLIMQKEQQEEEEEEEEGE